MCEKMEINRVEKLVPNLNDKEKYVVHINVLNQALKHGLILEKVHRVIKFNQSAWLKSYIDFNTKLGTQIKNDFEKAMENIRKHKNIKLVTNRESYLKTVMKPSFKSGICLTQNIMGCEMEKIEVTVNKPVYLGQVILDLRKLVMYEFHYDYMVPKYGENLKLCNMDTDSLIYHIKTEDFYAAGDVKERFDTSGYARIDPYQWIKTESNWTNE